MSLLSSYQILGLPDDANVSDAINSYNVLYEYYKKLDIPDSEKSTALESLDKAINLINDKDVKFNSQFNKDFVKVYKNQNKLFGSCYKINP